MPWIPTLQSCNSRLQVYHDDMSHRRLFESPQAPSSGTDEDVEPYFPEPLVELDLDTLE
jgi:hypothetical protein